MTIKQVHACFDVDDTQCDLDRTTLEAHIEMALAVYVDGYVFGSAYVAQIGDKHDPGDRG